MTTYIISIILFFILLIAGALYESISIIAASFFVMTAVIILNKKLFSPIGEPKRELKKSGPESVIKKLAKQQKKARQKGDWKKAQQINLNMHWIKCSYDNIKKPAPPDKLDISNEIHIKFARQIADNFARLIETDNKYRKCLYVPQSYLEYPIEQIEKALNFCISLCALSTAPEARSEKNVYEIRLLALKRYIDVDEKDLPSDVIQNMKYAKSLREL